MPEHPLRDIALIAVLILINAFVSAAEAALESMNEANIRKKAEEGDKKSENLLRLLDANTSYIHVIEFLFVTINILIGILFSFSHYQLISDFFRDTFSLAENSFLLGFLMCLVVIILIYIIVVVGVLFPKKLAIKHADRIVVGYGMLLRGISVILFPITRLAEWNTRFLLWLFRVKPEEIEDNVTEEEIISIVNEGQEKGVLEAGEAEMISNIIEFDEKEIKDIMTHRKKIIAIDANNTIEEALRFMLAENYSRFPLYQNDIDDIIGILHLKDVMRFYMDPELSGHPLTEAASEPYFVPDTQNIDLLLHDMQTKKMHMAIVIDEYGQTAGLVAMEDILEEIVGDIQDEYDDESETIFDQGDHVYLATGETPLEEIVEHTGIRFDEEDYDNYDTINGLLISKLDRIPVDGETADIDINGYRFEILDTQSKMIHMVRISKLPDMTEDTEN